MSVLTDRRPKVVRQQPRLAAVGEWLRRHQRAVRGLQWAVILVYLLLLIVPVLAPLPGSAAHIWNDAVLLAQFVFWGIWWPAVLISILLFGRSWCGLMCPEGALSEFASRHGRGRAVPRWMRWPFWPFVAFALVTVYGQMVSVYQYPDPALVVLGGSTAAAVAVGYRYGRGHRVWCRYLCPVTGVFGLLAKLAPVHFACNLAAWETQPPPVAGIGRVAICPPLVPLKGLDSASRCHMCGRCAGFRGAISLRARPPGSEVVTLGGAPASSVDTLLLLTGLLGIALGAFHWTVSPWFVALKQGLAAFLVGHGIYWPLEATLPWWLLTDYPQANDVMTLLDGVVLLAYVAATAVAMTALTGLPLAVANRLLGQWRWPRFHHLALSILPVAAAALILALSGLTVTMLRAEGFALGFVDEAQATVLALAGLWSLRLLWQVCGRYRLDGRRLAATVAGIPAILAGTGSWALYFWS